MKKGSINAVMLPFFLKGYFTFFLEIGSFYNSPRVKQLSLTIFESILTIF